MLFVNDIIVDNVTSACTSCVSNTLAPSDGEHWRHSIPSIGNSILVWNNSAITTPIYVKHTRLIYVMAQLQWATLKYITIHFMLFLQIRRWRHSYGNSTIGNQTKGHPCTSIYLNYKYFRASSNSMQVKHEKTMLRNHSWTYPRRNMRKQASVHIKNA